jgi:hypothetical protein
VVVSQDSWVIKMGLNNIQKSKQKVLNRPMFAKMKNGELKKFFMHKMALKYIDQEKM